jgi:hypothetical protein
MEQPSPLSVRCPTCRAKPGEPCRAQQARTVRRGGHIARVNLVKAKVKKASDEPPPWTRSRLRLAIRYLEHRANEFQATAEHPRGDPKVIERLKAELARMDEEARAKRSRRLHEEGS